MKVTVELKEVGIYSGVVEMTEEKFKWYKTLKDMHLISSILMKGLEHSEEWSIECFEELKDKNDDRGQ